MQHRDSDVDFDAYYHRGDGTYSGLQRSCSECGDPVWVSRREQYQIRICCERCQREIAAIRLQPADTEVA